MAHDIHRVVTGHDRNGKAVVISDAPATIALAVSDGHLAARELDAPPENPDLPFRREEIALAATV